MATLCPKCGGSGHVPWQSNGFASTAVGSFGPCPACAGIGVILDPAPVVNVHIHVGAREDESPRALAERVAAEVRKALGREMRSVGRVQ